MHRTVEQLLRVRRVHAILKADLEAATAESKANLSAAMERDPEIVAMCTAEAGMYAAWMKSPDRLRHLVGERDW